MDERSSECITGGSGEPDEAPEDRPGTTWSCLPDQRSPSTGTDATIDQVVDRRPLTDSLTPDEVCAEFERLHQALLAREAEHRDADASEIADQLDQLFDDVATLPKRDVERARDVYGALAESEHRAFAAMLMPELAEADPEFALPIWRELLGDGDPAVRSLAYDALTSSALQRLDSRQILPLYDTYLAAERGESTGGIGPSDPPGEK